MAANLITFDEYLKYTAQLEADLDPTDVDRINKTIASASTAVRAFCDRNMHLAADEPAGPRQYRYLGTGFLDIDDCTAINSVSTVPTSFAVSRTLDVTEWFALAEGRVPVIEQIEFYTRFLASGLSPEMGFKRNLDNYPWVPYPSLVSVDAVWGWPSIPEDIKQATVWTCETFINFKGQSPFDAQAIAGYSVSYNQFQSRSRFQAITQAVPDHAIAVLEPYMRITV